MARETGNDWDDSGRSLGWWIVGVVLAIGMYLLGLMVGGQR